MPLMPAETVGSGLGSKPTMLTRAGTASLVLVGDGDAHAAGGGQGDVLLDRRRRR